MPNRTNKKGVSLVEVMISLVILLIVSMGLIQASLLSVASNVRNEVRDEAVRIASGRMTQLRSLTFTAALLNDTDGVRQQPGPFVQDDLDPDTAGVQNTVTKTARNTTFSFSADKIIDDLDPLPGAVVNKQVTVRVSWTYQGEPLTHSISTIVINQ